MGFFRDRDRERDRTTPLASLFHSCSVLPLVSQSEPDSAELGVLVPCFSSSSEPWWVCQDTVKQWTISQNKKLFFTSS